MNHNENSARRDFIKRSLAGTVVLTAGASFAGSLLLSNDVEAMPHSSNGLQQAATEKQFRDGVIGPAELSLVTSQIAVEKATNKYVKEFASFELTEAIGVTGILKELNTAVPPMDAKAKATLNKIKTTAKGTAFDKAYIQAQIENHEFLRDLATNYISNAKGKTSPAESHTRHLATLALATFKEHVAITKQILTELG